MYQNSRASRSANYQSKSALYSICWNIASCVPDVDEAMLNRGIDQLFGHLELGVSARGGDIYERDVGSRCHDISYLTDARFKAS